METQHSFLQMIATKQDLKNGIAVNRKSKIVNLLSILVLLCLFGIFWHIQHYPMPSLDWIVIEPGILQVIAIAFLVWLILLKISKLIVDRLLAKILHHLETYFETSQQLTSWQQHVLYLALFALLMLSGTGCLIAIC